MKLANVMVAQVFSFFQSKTRASPSTDWSTQEIAEFYRVESSLIQSGMSVSVDRGLTDEGDPWFVFCRSIDGEVIIHFARIASDYLIVSESTGQTISGPDFRRLLAEFAATNPTLVPLKTGKSSKLLIHPAALLAAIVAAAFFHLSGSEAVASEMKHGAVEDEDARHLASSRTTLFNRADLTERSNIGFDPDRTQTNKQIIAAMAAMIGLVALDLATAVEDLSGHFVDALLDLSNPITERSKVVSIELATAEHAIDAIHSDDIFSINFRDPVDLTLQRGSDAHGVAQLNAAVVPANAQNVDFSLSVMHDEFVRSLRDHVEVPVQVVTDAEILPLFWVSNQNAIAKHGSSSFVGAGLSRSQSADISQNTAGAPDRAQLVERAGQSVSIVAMDTVSSNLSGTDRAVTITLLHSDFSIHDIINFAAVNAFGSTSANIVVNLIDRSFVTSHVGSASIGSVVNDISSNAVGGSTSFGDVGNGVSHSSSLPGTAEVAIAVPAMIADPVHTVSTTLPTSSASLSSSEQPTPTVQPAPTVQSTTLPMPSAALLPNAPLSSSTTPASTLIRTDAFDKTADTTLKAFIRENRFDIYSSGTKVVLFDLEPSHYSGDGFIVRTWSMDDGSTISIIGHLSHIPAALV